VKGVDPMGFADTREVAESAWQRSARNVFGCQ
jgi:hypothetical protein